MLFWCCYCNIYTVVLDLDNDSGKPAAVKTCHSLDTPLQSENRLKTSSVVSTSLESVFARPGSMANDRIREIRSINDRDRGTTTGHHVSGIGPSVSDPQVRDVIEYFQKCAADNGGYVYEFDIESDQCPQLDALPTSNLWLDGCLVINASLSYENAYYFYRWKKLMLKIILII